MRHYYYYPSQLYHYDLSHVRDAGKLTHAGPALLLPNSPSPHHNPQRKTSILPAASKLLKTGQCSVSPFLPSPFRMQRRETLNAEHHGQLLDPHPFPNRDFIYMKRSITRQAGQPLSNATSSIMTHKRRQALTEASTLKQRNGCERRQTQPHLPLWTLIN